MNKADNGVEATKYILGTWNTEGRFTILNYLLKKCRSAPCYKVREEFLKEVSWGKR
ncbi:MAG: hypothetical protein HZA06_01595 [Nitrospirae bacterium]|nr:hypothetical protein [Nitrospirota bacterium]